MPSIQINVNDGQQPIIIEVPAQADFDRFMQYLAGYTQFREDASRFVFEAQKGYRRYLDALRGSRVQPYEFLEYLAKVREATDEEMVVEYRQNEAIKASMQPDTSLFGLVKAHPAELTTGRCARTYGCVCDHSTPDARATCQFWEEK